MLRELLDTSGSHTIEIVRQLAGEEPLTIVISIHDLKKNRTQILRPGFL